MFDLNEGGLFYYLATRNLWNESAQITIMMCFLAASIVIAYLLGSLNTSILISKIFFRDDVRRHGSGNAGLTNMLRTYGKGAALGTLLGDILKTVIAIFVPGILFGLGYINGVSTSQFCYVAGLFAVMGHVFPIYYKFKGGKGVLSTAAMIAMLSPIPFAILISVFIIIVAISKYVSLGSVVGAVLFPIILNGYFAIALGGQMLFLIAFTSIALAILVVWCHRENLKRISNRTERKLSFKKKPLVQQEEAQKAETDDEED